MNFFAMLTVCLYCIYYISDT